MPPSSSVCYLPYPRALRRVLPAVAVIKLQLHSRPSSGPPRHSAAARALSKASEVAPASSFTYACLPNLLFLATNSPVPTHKTTTNIRILRALIDRCLLVSESPARPPRGCKPPLTAILRRRPTLPQVLRIPSLLQIRFLLPIPARSFLLPPQLLASARLPPLIYHPNRHVSSEALSASDPALTQRPPLQARPPCQVLVHRVPRPTPRRSKHHATQAAANQVASLGMHLLILQAPVPPRGSRAKARGGIKMWS